MMMIMIVQPRFKCILTLYSPASGSSCYIVDIQQIPVQLCSQPSPLSCLGQPPSPTVFLFKQTQHTLTHTGSSPREKGV